MWADHLNSTPKEFRRMALLRGCDVLTRGFMNFLLDGFLRPPERIQNDLIRRQQNSKLFYVVLMCSGGLKIFRKYLFCCLVFQLNMQTFVSELTTGFFLCYKHQELHRSDRIPDVTWMKSTVVMYYMTQIVGPKGNLCGECVPFIAQLYTRILEGVILFVCFTICLKWKSQRSFIFTPTFTPTWWDDAIWFI